MEMTRGKFLRMTPAAGVSLAAGPGRHGVPWHGVGYEVTDGESPSTGWTATRMRADLHAIHDRLGATSVSVFGDGVERLAATASEAAERGLHVWLQPRLGDVPEHDILDHLAETGRAAERLRRQGANIHLSVGCEFALFVPGIVPGADAVERVENLLNGNYDPVAMSRKLRRFVGLAARTGRSVFDGRLTYGAASDDEVDWTLFDIVSVNYYAYHQRRADYVRELKQYQRWGKPVAIAEFGTCTFEGAPAQGGLGWRAIDYTKQPPEVAPGLVRSEETQADYLVTLLDVVESMNLYAAIVYNFVTPDAPHQADPRYDYDLASYAIVKPIVDGDTWHWEPKAAFHALARRWG